MLGFLYYMNFVLQGGKRFEYLAFDTEEEFEQSVIEHAEELFGQDVIYLDTKKLLARRGEWRGGIPDGFLIDLTDPTDPHLYFVENELASHDVYKHIAEQVARFLASASVDTVQIRSILTNYIRNNQELLKTLEKKIEKTQFHNIDDLMNSLVEREIRVVVVIDEETEDLNHVLSVFQQKPDVAILQRYVNMKEELFVCQPMREDLADVQQVKTKGKKTGSTDYDTIVCPAYEDGFKTAFMEQNAWWAIRMSQEARERVKYLAIYQKTPVGAVQYYAEVNQIQPYKNSGKFIVHVKNRRKIKPIKLDKGKRGVAPQGPRFTTIEKVKTAKKISDLWG